MTAAQERVVETTVGLEIHVELATSSKMFCGCRVGFAGEPNTRTCPVCLGLPGSLPVINRRAVEYTMRIAAALNCNIARHSVFARKNYFYPDMPKNYQISQYELPLGRGGWLEIACDSGPRRVGITRVHLEEDTGSSLHIGGSGRIADSDYSLEDFNRAGTPLVEIVTEPDIKSADEARTFVTELRAIIEALGVSDVRMEEGSLRVDANISVRYVGEAEHGAKVEVKNMNSIRSVGRALAYEAERQRDALAGGALLNQETRHFDEKMGTTSSMRTKEFAFDYRYFPDPDLVALEPSEEWIAEIESSMPELPAGKRARWAEEYGLRPTDIGILTTSSSLADWFEEAARAYDGPAQKVVNWVIADLFGLCNDAGIEVTEGKIKPAQLAGLVKLVDAGSISGKQAKAVLAGMFEGGGDAEAVAQSKGLQQLSDEGALTTVVDEVIAENGAAADKVRAGQMGAVGFLVGRVMRKTKGQANPKLVSDLLTERLSG